jgi:hypothetical protein
MAAGDTDAAGASDLVKAGTVQNPALAEQARTRLEDAGIEATLRAEPHVPAGADLSLAGQVDVLVPSGQLSDARRILAGVMSQADVPLEEERGGGR